MRLVLLTGLELIVKRTVAYLDSHVGEGCCIKFRKIPSYLAWFCIAFHMSLMRRPCTAGRSPTSEMDRFMNV